jgi:hypothetical protein
MNEPLLDTKAATVAEPEQNAPTAGACPETGWFSKVKDGAGSGRPEPPFLAPKGFGLLLFLLIAITFPEVVSGQHTFFYRDFGLFGYPLAYYHRALFWHGQWALWNPYNDCGLPFLAQWNTLALYPGSLIYLLFPLPWSLSAFVLSHLWLAGMAMYFLAREWTNHTPGAAVAGVVYALNGLMLHAVMWPNNIAALAWLPLVVLLMERAWTKGGTNIIKAGLAGAVQMLAGAPEVILFTWLIVGTLWAMHLLRGGGIRLRHGLRVTGAIGLVGMLSAAQLLPFLALLSHSHRSSNFGGNSWSMPSWGWANFFVPLFHCSKSVIGVYSQDLQQWTSSYYLGLGAMALAGLALVLERNVRVWVLTGLSVLGVAVALGDNGGLLPALKACFPQLGFARYSIKAVVLPVFAIPLMAGYGTRSLERLRLGGSKWLTIIPVTLVWLVSLALVGAILCYAWWRPVLGERFAVTLQSGLSRAAFMTAILGALLVALEIKRTRAAALLIVITVVLLGLDCITHAPRQNPTLPVAALRQSAVDLSFMPKLGEGRAMITPRVQTFLGHAATPDRLEYHFGHRKALLGNLNLVQEVPKINGFYSLYLKDGAAVESLLQDNEHPLPAGLMNFLGVTQVSSDTDWFAWQARTNASPLVTIGAEPAFADRETALRALADPGFSGQEKVYLPLEAKSWVTAHRTHAQIQNLVFAPQQIRMSVSGTDPSMLVVAQNFYDCWQASVDGHSVRLWPANAAFQALEVPAGSHEIRLEYRDSLFRWGGILSASALFPSVLLWMWAAIRNRGRHGKEDPDEMCITKLCPVSPNPSSG